MNAERTNLQSTESVFWILKELRQRREFRYDDWAEQFNEDRDVRDLRHDRRFSNHLKFVREHVVPEFWGEQTNLKSEAGTGRYYLHRGTSHWPADSLADRNERDFFPVFQAFNRQPTLSPKPVPELEKVLQGTMDIGSEASHRLLFKNTFPWAFPVEYLTTFLDAVHARTCLHVIPSGGLRKPLTVTPLFLVNCDGAWHLVAQRDECVLQYNLSRVDALTLVDEEAEAVSRTGLQELREELLSVFGSNFVVPRNAEPFVAVVAFRGIARQYALERFPGVKGPPGGLWYETEVGDEEVRVRVKVNAPWELVSELLRWGSDAEALEPKAFRAEWLEAAVGV